MGKYDKKRAPSPGGVAAREGSMGREGSAGASAVADNPQLQEVAQWLATVKFRRAPFGGLDAEDVWKKLDELNSLYEKALVAERVRYNLLIRQLRLTQREDPDGQI